MKLLPLFTDLLTFRQLIFSWKGQGYRMSKSQENDAYFT